LQTKFRQFSLPKAKSEEFEVLIKDTVKKLIEEGISPTGIDRIIRKDDQLEKVHTKLRRLPEEVTKGTHYRTDP
jgi:hypothetical protein